MASSEQTEEQSQVSTTVQAAEVDKQEQAKPTAELSDKELRHLLKTANVKLNTDESKRAQARIAQLDLSHIHRMLAILRKTRNWQLAVILAIALAFRHFVNLHATGVIVTFICGSLAAFLGTVLGPKYPGSRLVYNALARANTAESLIELINALAIPDRELQHAIRPARAIALRNLNASDAKYLDSTSRRKLREALEKIARRPAPKTQLRQWRDKRIRRSSREVDKELMLAALTALRQVGDRSFVNLVYCLENRIEGKAFPEFQSAAAECMPYLRQASKTYDAGGVLLRSANPVEAADAEMLVRPASGRQSESAEELLRPAE